MLIAQDSFQDCVFFNSFKWSLGIIARGRLSWKLWNKWILFRPYKLTPKLQTPFWAILCVILKGTYRITVAVSTDQALAPIYLPARKMKSIETITFCTWSRNSLLKNRFSHSTNIRNYFLCKHVYYEVERWQWLQIINRYQKMTWKILISQLSFNFNGIIAFVSFR